MTFSFGGRGEAHMTVDPQEFAGYSRMQIAAELHGMAKAKMNLDYEPEDFFAAADQVLSALQSAAGVRW